MRVLLDWTDDLYSKQYTHTAAKCDRLGGWGMAAESEAGRSRGGMLISEHFQMALVLIAIEI